MPFETRIRELSRELENCDDDARTMEILGELQQAIHERIEQIRGEMNTLHLIRTAGMPVGVFEDHPTK